LTGSAAREIHAKLDVQQEGLDFERKALAF
jgi:hypothetical protein